MLKISILTALVLGLVRAVFTIVTSVANCPVLDAERVLALEHCLWAITSVWEPRWTSNLVTQVTTILATIATKFFLDAVATGALKLVLLQKQTKKNISKICKFNKSCNFNFFKQTTIHFLI